MCLVCVFFYVAMVVWGEQIDYNGRLSLTQFEALVQPLVERMDAPVMRALEEAGVTKEQLGSVEIVGGATRQANVAVSFLMVLGGYFYQCCFNMTDRRIVWFSAIMDLM